jgi:hypothetical protein
MRGDVGEHVLLGLGLVWLLYISIMYASFDVNRRACASQSQAVGIRNVNGLTWWFINFTMLLSIASTSYSPPSVQPPPWRYSQVVTATD